MRGFVGVGTDDDELDATHGAKKVELLLTSVVAVVDAQRLSNTSRKACKPCSCGIFV